MTAAASIMPRAAADVAYEAGASLGLVTAAVEDLQREGAVIDHAAGDVLQDLVARPGGLANLAETLARAVEETTDLIARLRQSRHVLERAAVDRLSQMTEKLKEVSSATEVAATDILNGMDRISGLVDEMEAAADPEVRKAIGKRVREEVFTITIAMQFQDITSQQLAFTSTTITQVEDRLTRLVVLLTPFAMDGDAALAPDALAVAADPGDEAHRTGPATFDPNATTGDATSRQALADSLFE